MWVGGVGWRLIPLDLGFRPCRPTDPALERRRRGTACETLSWPTGEGDPRLFARARQTAGGCHRHRGGVAAQEDLSDGADAPCRCREWVPELLVLFLRLHIPARAREENSPATAADLLISLSREVPDAEPGTGTPRQRGHQH